MTDHFLASSSDQFATLVDTNESDGGGVFREKNQSIKLISPDAPYGQHK